MMECVVYGEAITQQWQGWIHLQEPQLTVAVKNEHCHTAATAYSR